MPRTRKVGPSGALGPRYGTVVRKRYAKVVSELRKRHECPRCRFKRVSRVSVGIWACRKCGYKFSGGAYTPVTKLSQIAQRSVRGLVEESSR